MRFGVALMGCIAMGVAMNASASEDRRWESRYPKQFYTLRAVESKEPGVHKVRIDNRVLEISLPDSTPDDFFMPEAVRTNVKDEAYEKALLNGRVTPFECFSVGWEYGLLRGAWVSGSGGMGASVKVVPHTEIWIKDPGVTTTRGKYTFKGKRPIELDYFKLDDFIRAVHMEGDTAPYWVEVINGRQWVRTVRWLRWDRGLPDMPPRYVETFYTPLDRRRILSMSLALHYGKDYDIPDGMNGWMRELSERLTMMLRSLKISPPDDGSPDPFLIDPAQKAEANPVVFPARRPHPAPKALAAPGPSPR
jgi:hypothetical protein